MNYPVKMKWFDESDSDHVRDSPDVKRARNDLSRGDPDAPIIANLLLRVTRNAWGLI